jgi:hypothetical protein
MEELFAVQKLIDDSSIFTGSLHDYKSVFTISIQHGDTSQLQNICKGPAQTKSITSFASGDLGREAL